MARPTDQEMTATEKTVIHRPQRKGVCAARQGCSGKHQVGQEAVGAGECGPQPSLWFPGRNQRGSFGLFEPFVQTLPQLCMHTIIFGSLWFPVYCRSQCKHCSEGFSGPRPFLVPPPKCSQAATNQVSNKKLIFMEMSDPSKHFGSSTICPLEATVLCLSRGHIFG